MYFINHKIRAGALQVAIFILLILSILIASIIILFVHQNQKVDFILQKQQQTDNLKSAIALVTELPDLVEENTEQTLSLIDSSEVLLNKRRWGSYLIIKSSVLFRSTILEYIVFVGSEFSSFFDKSFYLADHNNYLSVVGDTYLKGTCFVPKLGIRRGNIRGTGYRRFDLVEGETKISTEKMPDVNPKFISEIQTLQSNISKKSDSVIHFDNIQTNELIFNSFSNKPLIIYSESNLSIDYMHMKGNIILTSEKHITIGENSELENIIVVSPSILIAANFSGAAQFIASDSLYVGENCQFIFPSMLLLYDQKGDPDSKYLQIKESTGIDGGVFSIVKQKTDSKKVQLQFEEGVRVNGIVYCNTTAQLKGKLYAQVFVNKLTLLTPAARYNNHLLDVTVNPSRLPAYFCAPVTGVVPEKQKVIQQLY